jgi:hypothetical protein
MPINLAIKFERSFVSPQCVEESRVVQPHNESKTILRILPSNQNHLLLAFIKDEGGTLSILMLSQFGRHW